MLEKGYKRKKTRGGYWHYVGLSWASGASMDGLLEASGYGHQSTSSISINRGDIEVNKSF